MDFLEFLQAQVGGEAIVATPFASAAAHGPRADAGSFHRSAASHALDALLREFADEGLSAQELADAADAFKKAETSVSPRSQGTLVRASCATE